MSADNAQPKKFSFRPQDAEYLVQTKTHTDAIFSIAVSKLVAERLGYQPTERTQFRLSPDLQSIEVWERPLESGEQPSEVANGSDDGIVAA